MSMLRIAHVSDLHFGTVLPQVETAAINAVRNLKPDLIIASGDITQRARTSQFKAARDFLDQLRPIPVVTSPGNHDIPLFNIFGRFFAPYSGYTKHFNGSLDTHFSFPGVDVLVLNSTSKFRHVQGSLDLKLLETRLSEYKNTGGVRVVAFHHPMDCLKVSDEKNLLCNRTGALELLSRYKVDLVLSGHIHDPVTRLSTLRYPDVLPAMIFSVAGTTTSWRTRRNAPNSFNIYDVETGSRPAVQFTRQVFTPQGEFMPEEMSYFRREGADWQTVQKVVR